jgi:hypothetical protein
MEMSVSKNFKFISVLLFLFCSACGGKKVVPDSHSEVVREGLLSMNAKWFKIKGKKVDADFVIHNRSQDFLTIPNSDLVCLSGDMTGKPEFRMNMMGGSGNLQQLKNMVKDELSFSPDEEKELQIICKFENSADGKFGLKIKSVYHRVGTNGDAVTLKKIAENIVWQVK